MKAIYLGDFDPEQKYPLIKSGSYYDGFDVSDELAEQIKKLDIIVGAYNKEYYSGDAFVLFRDNEKLYEVNDYHCSCNGLENWEPEETTKDSLLRRIPKQGNYHYGVWGNFKGELSKIINLL